MDGEERHVGKVKQSARGLRGYRRPKHQNCAAVRKRVRWADNMRGRTSSLEEAMESNEEAMIAAGMLDLAIACTQRREEATSKPIALGNLLSCSKCLQLRARQTSFSYIVVVVVVCRLLCKILDFMLISFSIVCA